jgi:hypothetical protein
VQVGGNYPRLVKIVPRRNAPSADVPADAGNGVDAQEDIDSSAASVHTGKGRPTPKRRDSVPQRGPVTAPKTRKEAYARQKQQAREARVARKSGSAMTTAERRRAMRAGDPATLPRRDQGQTKKLARDYVDSHRMISNFLLLLFPVLIASSFIPALAAVAPLVLLVIVVEWYLIGRRIRRLAAERFGSADGGNMSIGFYAGSRAYLPRRWRLPAPQVHRGDAI